MLKDVIILLLSMPDDSHPSVFKAFLLSEEGRLLVQAALKSTQTVAIEPVPGPRATPDFVACLNDAVGRAATPIAGAAFRLRAPAVDGFVQGLRGISVGTFQTDGALMERQNELLGY